MKKIIFISAALFGMLFLTPNSISAQNRTTGSVKLKKVKTVTKTVAKDNKVNSKKVVSTPAKTTKVKSNNNKVKKELKKVNVVAPRKVNTVKPIIRKKAPAATSKT